jgi:hypothetical protein
MDHHFKNTNVKMICELSDSEEFPIPYDYYFTVGGKSGYGTIILAGEGEKEGFYGTFMGIPVEGKTREELIEKVYVAIHNCLLIKKTSEGCKACLGKGYTVPVYHPESGMALKRDCEFCK